MCDGHTCGKKIQRGCKKKCKTSTFGNWSSASQQSHVAQQKTRKKYRSPTLESKWNAVNETGQSLWHQGCNTFLDSSLKTIKEHSKQQLKLLVLQLLMLPQNRMLFKQFHEWTVSDIFEYIVNNSGETVHPVVWMRVPWDALKSYSNGFRVQN